MLAYANLRHSWFKDKNGNHDKERTEAWDAMHAENGLPVVLSEAFFVLSIYYWLAPLYADAQLELGKNGDPVLLLVLGGALFVLSALSGMQQHRVECAHFKTDIN